MARTIQASRKTIGGRVPRKQLASRPLKRSIQPGPPAISRSYNSQKTPGPRLHADWYMNSQFCDITIKYGPDSSVCFDGHRLILSNSSEWFQHCTNPGFTEATSRVITLNSDFPEALEALFEFCYCDTYTVTFAGKSDFEIAKNEFIQHARILVVADKYMAEGLVEHAADRLRGFITVQIDEVENQHKSAFFKFAVEQVYINPHIFGFDRDAMDTNEQVELGKEAGSDANKSTMDYNGRLSGHKIKFDDDEGVGHSSETLSNSASDDADPNMPAQVGEIDDFDPNELEALYNNKPVRHPLDRLQQIMATAAMNVWISDNEEELGRQHLAVLVKQIPQFGADLAVVAMGYGTLEQDFRFGGN
jgi:hypothetical protein